jgi:hypothetical protein
MLTFIYKASNLLGYFRISEDKSCSILMDDACRNEDGQVEVDALSSGHVSGSQAPPVVTPASSPVARPTLAAWPCLYLKPTPKEEPEAGGRGNTAPSGTTPNSQRRTAGLEGLTKEPNRHAEDLNRFSEGSNRHTEDPNRRAEDPNKHAEDPERRATDQNRCADGLQGLSKLSSDCPSIIAPLNLTAAPLGRPTTVTASADDEGGDDDDDTACEVCHQTTPWATILLCDHCDKGWHTSCLDQPWVSEPEGDWFCHACWRRAATAATNSAGGGADGNGGAEEDISCEVCHKSTPWGTMILCDQCDQGYHIGCVDPPLASVPEGEWSCPTCRPGRSGAAERRDPEHSQNRSPSGYTGVYW